MNNPLLPGSSRLSSAAWAPPQGFIVPLRDLWNPGSARQSFCPIWPGRFLWMAGMKTGASRTSAAWFRDAFWLHQRKGTIAAVHRAVGYHGFTAEVAEWWDTGDPRGTFRLEVDVNETGLTAKY
jgi:phage tail P2-like protein